MKLIILAIIIIASLVASYKLTPNIGQNLYAGTSLFVGIASFLISIFVVYIAYTVEKHILAKAALNDIRKLHKDACKWDLTTNCMTAENKNYALRIINAALEDKYIEEHIKEKLKLCKSELENAQPSLENFLNFLEAVVQRINLT